MRSGIVVFPGSNCDRDVYVALKNTHQNKPLTIWHKETEIPNLDLIIIPGGFSFGDYLRSGAIASKSPIIPSLKNHASRGGAILGICNGFQILLEVGFLPGTLQRNKNLKFICKEAELIINETIDNPFTTSFDIGTKLKFPIAHNEGNYYASEKQLKQLEENKLIAFKYLKNANPNGSKNDIAGILSDNGRILGMMPHPERAVSKFHKSSDGITFFDSLIKNLLN